MWTSVLRFYREIHEYDKNIITFPTTNANTRTIRRFMTEDEYSLSRRDLKINARAYKENKLLTTAALKMDTFIKERKIYHV